MLMPTALDLFCGAGGSSTGMAAAGVRVVMAANHWQLAVDVHQANHPQADHDCFPAGTLVLTSTGMRPIESIEPGETVLTHRGRWRPVVRKFGKRDDTVRVRSVLHAAGVEVTPNHEFWTRRSVRTYRNGRRTRDFGKPQWREIGAALIDRSELCQVARDSVALPHSFGELPWEDPPERLGEPLGAWWLVGRWLGDGSSGAANHDVTITCGYHDADDLAERIPATWRRRALRTATQFYCYDIKLATWLSTNFGSGASGKGIPGWVLAMPKDRRAALLDGYMSADGSANAIVARCSTISKSLALGVRLLAHSLGRNAGLHSMNRGEYGVIEGRTVRLSPSWAVQWTVDECRSSIYRDDHHSWGYIQAVEPARQDIPVYTMEVAEDHSYVADGLVVKNCADISAVDPRRYPATDILWASPECTNHSVAKGMRRVTGQGVLFGDTPDPSAERSRATMWDVPRFAEAMLMRGRPYEFVVVENVVDARWWVGWRGWAAAMEDLGYDHHVVYLNSAFAHGKDYGGAPQYRDRIYVVFWRRGMPGPDLDIRPPAWCPRCEKQVDAVQAWKKPHERWGRYRAQYVYQCPDVSCRAEVEPLALPAATVIDWSDLGGRIGDRPRPLAQATRERIRAGLARYGRALVTPAGGTWNDTAQPVDVPMRARTARENEGLACPPLVVPTESRDGLRCRPAGEPKRTQTGRQLDALTVPEPFLTMLRNNCDAIGVAEPLATVVAAGNHHALTVPDGALLVPYYGTGVARPVSEPAGTVTTRDRHALAVRDPADVGDGEVDDCTFRMLTPAEIGLAMAFPADYAMSGPKRDRVRMYGNAVTPPAARLIVERILATRGIR